MMYRHHSSSQSLSLSLSLSAELDIEQLVLFNLLNVDAIYETFRDTSELNTHTHTHTAT